MSDIENLFAATATVGEHAHPLPHDVPAALRARRRIRQRRRTQLLAVPVVAGAAAGAALAPGWLAGPDRVRTATAPDASPEATPETSVEAAVRCDFRPADDPGPDAAPPPDVADQPPPSSAELVLSDGTVELALLGDRAPCTTTSFAHLARTGFFDGTSCHRLTTADIFVLQCGDPTASGSGGPGYTFADENLGGAVYPVGTVAMANSGPASNGSQFFLVYADTELPPSYTPFARVTSGLDILRRIGERGSDASNGASDGKPTVPVQVERVTVPAG